MRTVSVNGNIEGGKREIGDLEVDSQDEIGISHYWRQWRHNEGCSSWQVVNAANKNPEQDHAVRVLFENLVSKEVAERHERANVTRLGV